MCAVKIIKKKDVDSNEVLRGLMKDELHILEDMDHPTIMRIYELLHDNAFYYIVSEFIRYGQLYEYIVAKGK
jgi:serine/threonine protein kinase